MSENQSVLEKSSKRIFSYQYKSSHYVFRLCILQKGVVPGILYSPNCNYNPNTNPNAIHIEEVTSLPKGARNFTSANTRCPYIIESSTMMNASLK